MTPQTETEQTLIDFSQHVLTVEVDDDGREYRHLICRRPETIMYSFEITTWPGYLSISGDIGCYVFSRERDMIRFFAAGDRVNLPYWAEKVKAASTPARTFSHERLEEELYQWAEERLSWDEDFRDEDALADLKKAISLEILLPCEQYSSDSARVIAYDRMSEFSWCGISIEEFYEMDFNEFSHEFQRCCEAILWAVREYRKLNQDN